MFGRPIGRTRLLTVSQERHDVIQLSFNDFCMAKILSALVQIAKQQWRITHVAFPRLFFGPGCNLVHVRLLFEHLELREQHFTKVGT